MDLIACVRNKSDGPGALGARGGSALPPATNPAAARLRTRRSSPKPVLRGSFRAWFGSGRYYAICVIHPRQRNSGLGPGRTLARRGAALGLGARRGAACRPLCGSDARAKGSCDLRKARLACAEVVRGCAGLQTSATAELRRQDAGVRGPGSKVHHGLN